MYELTVLLEQISRQLGSNADNINEILDRIEKLTQQISVIESTKPKPKQPRPVKPV